MAIGIEHVVGAPWVRKKQTMLNMAGNICDHCDERIFPPRDICPNCGDEVQTVYIFGSPSGSIKRVETYQLEKA